MTLKLNVIICSTRPGRIGPKVADWVFGHAREHGGFAVELVDLADFDLPVYDEPKHPRLQQYEHEHTKRWAASVASADAYVFVAPEYNYFAHPAFVNAVNYVFHEWNYKPAGLVNYGGLSGGLRAQQTEKLLLTTVKVVPLTESVAVPMVAQHIGADGKFTPNEMMKQGATAMLDELHRWAVALKPMRAA